MAKVIDPVDIKVAIKSGQLEVIAKRVKTVYMGEEIDHYRIYMKDTENGDTVLITEFDNQWYE